MSALEFCPQRLHRFYWEGDLLPLKKAVEGLEFRENTSNLLSLEMGVLDLPEFKELKNWTEECLAEVKSEEEIFGDRLVITESWANKSFMGHWHHRHVHPNSIVSGVFSFSTSNACTWFSIPDIWKATGCNLAGYHYPYNEREVIHTEPTEPGKLLLFPSSLHHSVDCHQGEEPRYTVSFNSFAEGTFGGPTGLLRIKVLNS